MLTYTLNIDGFIASQRYALVARMLADKNNKWPRPVVVYGYDYSHHPSAQPLVRSTGAPRGVGECFVFFIVLTYVHY